jgi:hypothetical protein
MIMHYIWSYSGLENNEKLTGGEGGQGQSAGESSGSIQEQILTLFILSIICYI